MPNEPSLCAGNFSLQDPCSPIPKRQGTATTSYRHARDVAFGISSALRPTELTLGFFFVLDPSTSSRGFVFVYMMRAVWRFVALSQFQCAGDATLRRFARRGICKNTLCRVSGDVAWLPSFGTRAMWALMFNGALLALGRKVFSPDPL